MAKRKAELKGQTKWDKTYKERQEAKGLVQVRYWIPKAERETIDRYIERKRKAVDKAA